MHADACESACACRYVGEGRRGLLTLKEKVLDGVMLRRNKVEKADELRLPPLTVRVERVMLGEDERDFYECIFKQTQTKFDSFVQVPASLHRFRFAFRLCS
jgi:DNA repair protein RAD16